MRIYFGFTVAGDRSTLEAARRIVATLEALGHVVLTKHLVRDDAREADRSISAQQVYERDMAWLQECDCFVAEVSGSSFGIGYEAGYLLASSRTALLFYRRDAAERLSLLITGNTHPGCTLVPYEKVEEMEAYLRDQWRPAP